MATFYIDYTNGSNTNPGTRSSPWKSHPYMQSHTACTVTGSPPSYPSPAAGDIFIFKGGTTWPVACFQISIPFAGSGTISAQTKYTVDTTYFNGASFTKPLWDMAFTVPSGNVVVTGAVTTHGFGYITFDNIEIKNQAINIPAGNNSGQAFSFENFSTASDSPAGIIISNCFLHDWGVTSQLTSSNQANYDAGAIFGNVLVDTCEISNANGFHYVSGVKTAAINIGGAVRGVTNNTTSEVKNSKIHDTSGACFAIRSCHDNNFYNQGQPTGCPSCSAIHSQVIEDDDGWGPTHAYNNLIHDMSPGVVIDVCQGASVYNNVIYNINNTAFGIRLAGTGGTGSTNCGSNITNIPSNIFNNTIVCQNTTCFGTDSHTGISVTGNVNLENNFFLHDSGSAIAIQEPITGTFTNKNNLTLSVATASGQGYSAANLYIPTAITNSTVGYGTNLTASCGGELLKLCTDPESAPWFGGSSVARPANTGTGTCGGVASITPCWDAGAYEFPTGNTNPPTVVLTSPPAGTVSGAQTLTLTCTPASPKTISQVYFQIDGTTFGATGSTSPYSQSWDTTTASNASHGISAFCIDSNALSNSASETVTVSNNMPGCFVSSNNWTTNQSFSSQSGQFVATFTVKPNAANLDDVVGFSNAVAGAFTNLAAILRLNASGNFDVRNAGTYQADNTVSYTAGTVYAFSMNINVPLHVYSVQLTSPSSVSLATNYAFRSEQSTVTSLGFVNMEGSATPNTAQLCNLVVTPTVSGMGGGKTVGSVQQFGVKLF